MAQIIVENLYKAYNRNTLKVLDNITFEARSEEFICLLGPSGCGKSTILNVLAGLQSYEGKVLIKKDGDNSRHSIGYVFQSPRLLLWKTVEDNLDFVLKIKNLSKTDRIEVINKYLNLVNLDESKRTYPVYLSGGMKARLSIARALAIQPDILLMDEPFSHLDEISARKMRNELLNIWEDNKRTVVFVTHSPREAIYLADKIFLLTDKPCKIFKEISIDYPRPRILTSIEMTDLEKKIIDCFETKEVI